MAIPTSIIYIIFKLYLSDFHERDNHSPKIRVFGREQECRDANFKLIRDTNWENLDSLVKKDPLESLKTPDLSLVNHTPIGCLKLVVHDTTQTDQVQISGMTVRYIPFLGIHTMVTRNWTGTSPSFQSFCKKDIEIENLEEKSCQARSNDTLYLFESGYNLCQCDQYCERFHDCCADHKGDELVDDLGFENVNITCLSQNFRGGEIFGLGIFVINSCKDHFQGTELEQKCRGRDLLASIPIQIKEHVFRNIFCTICNDIGSNVLDRFPWELTFFGDGSLKTREKKCNEMVNAVVDLMIENHSLVYDLFECEYPGYTFSKYNHLLSGSNRLGRMCFRDAEDQTNILSSMSTNKDDAVFVLKEYRGITAVTNPNCFCKFCGERIFPYLTSDMRMVSKFFAVGPWPLLPVHFDSFVHDGTISGIFSPVKEEEINLAPELPKLPNHKYPSLDLQLPSLDVDKLVGTDGEEMSTLGIVSLIGSCTSAVLLIGILIHMFKFEGIFSSAKRCQVGIFIAKLLFFVSFAGGSIFRRYLVACKLFSVMVHFAMYVSFANMIWFGIKVANLLYLVNNSMAALTVENKNPTFGKKEKCIFLGIWLVALCTVTSFWAYDTFVDSFFGYGVNQFCLMTKGQAMLYALIIPTAVIVVFNLGLIIFCLVQYVRIQDNQPKLTKNLLIFLARLMALQSVQWGLGVVYYFTRNDGVEFTLEVLLTYEGVFITVVRFFFKM